MLQGIDVSDRQGEVDWDAHHRDRIDFAIVKATEGIDSTDRYFARNWAEIKRVGIVRGAYHVACPDGDAVSAARHFVDVLHGEGLQTGDLIAIDLESSDGPPSAVAAHAQQWCAQVARLIGIRPMVYTYFWFAKAGNCEGLERNPLWIAAPSHPAGRPPVPLPWRTWAIHQYASSPIDLNVFQGGSREELRAMGMPDGRPLPF